MKQTVPKKLHQHPFNRIPLVISLVILQALWFIFLVLILTKHSWWITFILQFISFIVVLILINGRNNPAYKLAWTVPILVFPIFGGLLYLILGGKKPARRLRKKLNSAWNGIYPHLPENNAPLEALRGFDPAAWGQATYIRKSSKFPVYGNTRTTYYKSGECCFPDLLEALRQARHFIFLEFFIIAEGTMWHQILEVLKRKVREGIEVRIIYDGMGCFNRLPYRYADRLAEYGIRCRVFNPLIPLFTTAFNHRDHRKIVVVDGCIGFTGGINLADEYINIGVAFGYWKDAGIRLTGEAVYSLTAMFLAMWNGCTEGNDDPSDYRPPDGYPAGTIEQEGYVQPYADSPLDNEYVSENVYLNIITMAMRYVYIFTPYLIIDNEMTTALRLAAGRGVDVRIVTPGIPDKRLVFYATRFSYRRLMEAGVRIYEFTPGFMHAKCMISDDRIATVGSVNLDFRSLFLNFECGVCLFGTSAIAAIREDFIETMAKSTEFDLLRTRQTLPVRLAQNLLGLFAPML